jgi:hypothetical protein
MRSLGLGRYALSSCVAAAMLTGCGGSQQPIGAAGAMLQSPAVATHAAHGRSWVLPETQRSPAYKATQPLLYVTNYSNNNVTVYHASAKGPAPIATISDGLDFPAGDCIDSEGTLYVTNQPVSNGGWISEYPLGKTKASAFIKDGIIDAAYCAIDANGNLWVTNIGNSNVTEYLHGSKKPHTVITNGLDYPVGIAIDHSGTLYVANRPVSGPANVVVYRPESKTPTRTITEGITYPVGITVDAHATLYVTNFHTSGSRSPGNVEKYRAGQSKPYRTITYELYQPPTVIVGKNGWLYVAVWPLYTDSNPFAILEYPPHSIKASSRIITNGVRYPQGLAYYPPLLP